MSKIRFRFELFVLTASVLVPGFLRAQEAALLPQGARLAIVGDSITEQKIYSRYIEAYLLACAGRRDISVFQFGWGGETASGFAAREGNDLRFFKPTAMTVCYGMNDGGYRPYEESIGINYETGMRAIVTKSLNMGITPIILGSPGAVDTRFFLRAGPGGAAEYNVNLQHLGKIAQKLAAEYNLVFADVHTPMVEVMAKAKNALGDDYDVCGGRDGGGVHPGPNGHLIMAYVFLKAMGCDGNIGEITVNMKGGAAASTGHKVLSEADGKVELESERYPFCCDSDPKSSSSNRSILPFIPFNQELNRFTLKVINLTAVKAKVTWGGESKEFTGEQLSSGINLAAEFDVTPFDEAFRKVQQAVTEKQNFETKAIKSLISNFRNFTSEDFGFEDDWQTEWKKAVNALIRQLATRHEQLQAAVRTAIVPIKHTITITSLP